MKSQQSGGLLFIAILAARNGMTMALVTFTSSNYLVNPI
jgi:hypothetical protein